MKKNFLSTIFITISILCFSQSKEDTLSFSKFHKVNSHDTLDEKYTQTSDSIIELYVPKIGKSEYIVGEMLRVLFNVMDEATRNGNINWRREDKVGLLFINQTLWKSKIFPLEITVEIRDDINQLLRHRKPCTDRFVYIRIERRIIEYYWNKGNLKFTK